MASHDSKTKAPILPAPGQNFRSSVRLNYNHWLMKELCGYLLHPKIEHEEKAIRVADIGTGTGIWLLEAAGHLSPSARLDGFDTSPTLFPPEDFIPENVHLIIQDVFKAFPKEFVGKYDIVHIRFALCFVNNGDALPLLQNLMTLLKPGGYLQWFEPNVYATQVKAPASKPGTSVAATEQLHKLFRKPTPESTYDWVQGLPSLYEEHGLQLIDCHNIPMKESHRLFWSHSSLQGLEGLRDSPRFNGTKEAEGLHNMINGLNTEFAQGVSLDTPWLCVVGMKPL